MRVVWLEEAAADLAEVRRYIAQDNPGAAVRTARRIRQAVERLADTPHLGRPGRVPGTRELVVTGTPYIVPYHVTAGRVEILAVIHGARQWPGEF